MRRFDQEIFEFGIAGEIYRRGEDAMVGLFVAMQGQVEQLAARLSKLEGRLKRDSHSSDKPPSSSC